MVLVDDPQTDVSPVRSLEDAVVRDVSEERVSRRFRIAGRGGVLRRGGDIEGHPGQDAVGHGQVDEAALAGGRPVHQRGGDGQRGVQAGGQVRNQHGRDCRRIGAPQQAAYGEVVDVVAGTVPIGPLLSEPRYRAVHDGGIQTPCRWVIHAEPFGHAGPESFQHDVRPFDQAAHGLPSRLLFQIDHDVPLAAVHAGEGRGKAAQGIAAGRFHLDHPGAEIGKQHGTVGTGQLRGEVHHQVVGQRGDHGRSGALGASDASGPS